MKNIHTPILIALTFFTLLQIHPAGQQQSTNGALILLDDCERGFFEAISFDLLTALLSEAGPIITSASLLANMKKTKLPEEKDAQKLLETFNTLMQKEPSDEEGAIEKNIILSIKSLDQEMANRWVIKKVNTFLYLLIPKTFLRARQLSVSDAQVYTPQGAITQTEQALGLKINHMQTITNVADITTPGEEPEYAGYFTDGLPSIFVTNNQYANKKAIPSWALCMVGHATINRLVAGLSVSQFKEFLTFLATKITTKFLLYSSCYTVGVTSEAIFTDQETGVSAIYPFTIITQSLTEAMSYSAVPMLYLNEGKLAIRIPDMYTHFFATLASNDQINYRHLLVPFAPNFTSLASMPQIRQANSPRFEPLDSDTIMSLGRDAMPPLTAPLDVAAYAKKHGHATQLRALLLYTQDIPCELIINTPTMPACVSMIPGSAVHRIKKISSAIHPLPTILASFSAIHGLPPRKVFIIDQITAPTTPAHPQRTTFYNVIIDTTKTATTKMYTDGTGTIYELNEKGSVVASADAQKKYIHLIQKTDASVCMQELLDRLKTPLKADQAEKYLKDILDFMPDNSVVRIPQITSDVAQTCDAWCDMLFNLEYHTCPLGVHKLMWINAITAHDGTILYKDIILDKLEKGWFRVLFTSSCHSCPISLERGLWHELPAHYVPIYTKMFDVMDRHKKYDTQCANTVCELEKKAEHKLITFWYIDKTKTLHKNKRGERS